MAKHRNDSRKYSLVMLCMQSYNLTVSSLVVNFSSTAAAVLLVTTTWIFFLFIFIGDILLNVIATLEEVTFSSLTNQQISFKLKGFESSQKLKLNNHRNAFVVQITGI